MSKLLLQNLRKSVWLKAFPKTAVPNKWRNNHAKDLQNKIYQKTSTLLDTRLLLKFGGGKTIDLQSLNILAKYALLEEKGKKKSKNSATKTDYWQQFQNKVLGIEEPPAAEEKTELSIDTSLPSNTTTTENAISLPVGYQLAKFSEQLFLQDFPTLYASSNFYWQRAIDTQLQKSLKNQSAIWIEGAALVGKSRAIFEALKTSSDWLVVLPDLENLQAEMPPPPIVENRQTIVYFDDLLSYYQAYPHQTSLINNYLQSLLNQENIQVLVSNRTGVEAQLIADYLPRGLAQRFKKITIPAISFDDIESFQMEVDVRLDFNAFNNSIGSLLMGFSTVQRRYEQLEEIADLGWNFSQKVADTAQDILFALKHLHHVHHFKNAPHCFDLDFVKDFCLRIQGRKISQKQWQEAWDLLEVMQQKTVRFLQLRKDNTVAVQTAYLDFALETGLADSQIVRKIKEFYTTIEQQIENGFFLHPIYFSKRINIQQFYSQAQQILEIAIREGLQPNVAVFTSLLRKAPNFAEAQLLLQQMKQQKVAALDGIFFEVLLTKTENYAQAQEVHSMLQAANVPPNLTFFTTLLSKAETRKQVSEMATKMVRAKIPPSTAAFNIFIKWADAYFKVLQWRLTMKDTNCSPDLTTFLLQLQKCDYFGEAQLVWKELHEAGFSPSNKAFYHSYLNHATLLSEALEIKAEMEKNPDFDLDVQTFNTLLQLAENETQVQGFRKEMESLKIAPNNTTFAALIVQAVDFEAALDLLKEMPDYGLKASTEAYNALLKQAEDLNKGIAVFQEMHEQQVALNEDSFLILLGKTEGFEAGLRLLIQLQQLDYKAGTATFNQLITRAETIQPALQALRKMRQYSAKPNAATYALLINKVSKGNFKQAFNLFKTMKAEYIRPTEATNLALLKKVKGYEQAFVNQVLRLYPQTLADVDYHRIFAAILHEIDHHAFLKTAEEYIEKDEGIGELYKRWDI